MTVNIIVSSESGALEDSNDYTDMGEVSPGSSPSTQDIYIRHTASVNPITDCAFYITAYSGSGYLGSDTNDDYLEILGWGNTSGQGFMINQVIPAGWVSGDFDSSTWQRFRSGYGDINSQLILDDQAINIGSPAGDGIIPVSGEAHIQVKLTTPASIPSGTGYRGISLVMSYSATS